MLCHVAISAPILFGALVLLSMGLFACAQLLLTLRPLRVLKKSGKFVGYW